MSLVGPGSFPYLQALQRFSAQKQRCDRCSYIKCPQGGSTFPRLTDCWGKLSPTGSGLPGLSLGMSWPRKTAEGFCLPRASFSALTAKTSLKACIEVPWRVWSCLGEAHETRKLHSESPSPGEEKSSWVFQTPSAQGLHQYLGALRLGLVLAGPSASRNLCSHAERSKEYRFERGSNAGTLSLPP